MSVLRPDLMMKCVIPVIMAGIIAVSALRNREAYVVIEAITRRSTASSSPSSFPATVSISSPHSTAQRVLTIVL